MNEILFEIFYVNFNFREISFCSALHVKQNISSDKKLKRFLRVSQNMILR